MSILIPKVLLVCALSIAALKAWSAPGPEDIIPRPVSFTSTGNTYRFREDGKDIKVNLGDKAFNRELHSLSLPSFALDEAYRLTVGKDGIRIAALSQKGVLRARQSLSYMEALSDDGTIRQCSITDYPRFAHRGLMLDISRNFRSKDFILKQLDAMARVKLNSLHLHLTDSAGWRIEIDSYPELCNYAAWRSADKFTEWKDGSYAQKGSDGAYGGYLTKEDAKEIVAYAEKRGISIIPEIEMPGHCSEVTAAYPELSCWHKDGNGELVQTPTPDVCPSNEKTYEFFCKVLDEVIEIFPSRLIHIGGDEASRRAWAECPSCQALMRKEGMTDIAELQSYMTKRMEKHLLSRGRVLLGWDEIMEGGLAPEATVMSWRGTQAGAEAMAEGHDVIMCPMSNCYLDYPQDEPSRVPPAFGSYQPLKNVYKFNPQPDTVDEAMLPHLLGVQGNLWTEYVPTDEHAEFQLYPRAFAIAEIGWTPQEEKDYDNFRARALDLLDVLRADGYHPFNLADEFGDRPEAVHPAVHLALGCPVKYIIPYNSKYPADGKASLTDGTRGGYSYYDAVWQGFLSDIDVVIDLGEVKDIHFIGASFMSQIGVNIALPEKTEAWVSEDGENFTPLCSTFRELPDAAQTGQSFVLYGEVVNAKGRFVRYKAFRSGKPRHDWLFTDEILVN